MDAGLVRHIGVSNFSLRQVRLCVHGCVRVCACGRAGRQAWVVAGI